MEYTYKGRLKNKSFDELFEAILALDTLDECYMLFEDLCTIAELKSMAQRMEVAKMIVSKKTYGDIVGTTGASTATISRVKRSVNYGADGYTMLLEKMAAKNDGQNK